MLAFTVGLLTQWLTAVDHASEGQQRSADWSKLLAVQVQNQTYGFDASVRT